MFFRNTLNRLQLHNNQVLNNQVGKIFTETKTIAIIDFHRFLCLNAKSSFLKAMCQPIFINLLQQACAKIDMQIIGNLPNFCYKFFNLYVCHFFTSLHFYTSTRPFPLQPLHPSEVAFLKSDVPRRAALHVAAHVDRRSHAARLGLLRALDEYRVEDEERGVGG